MKDDTLTHHVNLERQNALQRSVDKIDKTRMTQIFKRDTVTANIFKGWLERFRNKVSDFFSSLLIDLKNVFGGNQASFDRTNRIMDVLGAVDSLQHYQK